MVEISLNNNLMGSLQGPLPILRKIYLDFRIRHPEAFFITRKNTRWDGYIDYITPSGKFKIGLFPSIVKYFKDNNIEFKIYDYRNKINITPRVPKCLGDKKLYPRQIKALELLLNNKIEGVPFLIEAGGYSVGFGKTLLFAGLFKAFEGKLNTILLLNDGDLFEQMKEEIPQLLPEYKEDISFIRGKESKGWGKFNIAMVQTLSRNLSKYQYNLSSVQMVLIDECDIIDNKTYRGIIQKLYNASIRIGLSGTLYMSDRAKDKVKNMNIKCFIGDKVDSVELIDQIKSKKATPVIVKMIYINPNPNFDFNSPCSVDYISEYKNYLISDWAMEESLQRTLYNARYGRFPMVIITKFIEHCVKLYQYYLKRFKELGLNYSLNFVHHEVRNRTYILRDFRDGKIDILISTLIIARGKNMPLLKYLQQSGSIDSHEKSIQILGRLIRKHESKDKTYLDDIVFPGKYLSRHGNHRKNYYLKQKLKVIKVKKS